MSAGSAGLFLLQEIEEALDLVGPRRIGIDLQVVLEGGIASGFLPRAR